MLKDEHINIVDKLKHSFGEANVYVNSYDEAVIKAAGRDYITITFNQGAYNVYCPDYGFYIDKYYSYYQYLPPSLIHAIRERVTHENKVWLHSDEWVVA